MATAIIPAIGAVSALSLTVAGALGTGWTAPAAPTSWDGPLPDQTLTVLVDHSAMADDVRYAPYSYTARVRVEGSIYGNTPVDRDLPDPTHNRVTVITVTEDTTLGRNTRVGDPAHRERSFRPGWQPMHVFTQPGTYNLVTYAYDENGKWGKSDPFQVVVTTPLDKILQADRIILSNVPGETWADAPPHDAANRVTTLVAAIDRFRLLNDATRPIGVFIKRGTTYAESGAYFDGGNGTPWGGVKRRSIVTTWGAGARPVLDPAPSLSFGNEAPLGFDGIEVVYSWDRQIEGYKPGRENLVASSNTYVFPPRVQFDVPHVIFNDCDVSDTASGSQVFYVAGSQTEPGFAVFFNDCELRDLGDYITLDSRRVGFLNSATRVAPGAGTGHMDRRQMGGRASDFGQSHNSIRQPTEGVYIDGSYMEGRGGWSGSNGAGMTHDHQALVRAQATGDFPGQRNHIARSVMIGDVQIGKSPKSIIESSVMVFDPAIRNNIGLQVGAMDAVRNCHFMFVGNADGLLPPHQTSNFDTDGSGLRAATFTGFIAVEEKNISAELQILHNSATVHRNAANLPTTWNLHRANGAALSTTTLVSAHNVTYAPDHANVPAGGVTLLSQPWEILDVWVRVGWERATYILPADLAPGATSDLIPYPLSLDLTQLTQANFAGTRGRHAVRVPFRSGGSETVYFDGTGDGAWGAVQNGCDILFEAGGFRVVNTSLDTWLLGATMRILLDRGTTLMDPWYYWTVPVDKVRLFRPNTAQAMTPGAPSALFEFSMRQDRLRPAAGFAISPSGTNYAGAMLP